MAETGMRKWIITITVILAALLEIIDSTVVNVALTNIMGNLGATLEEVAWVVTAYAVANVIIVPLTSYLSVRFGRTNYFVFSILLFTAASFFCGHAENIWELVLFRFIQGIGGGALLSTSQAILVETFPPEEIGMATALFGMGVVVGPTVGPTLGGYITDTFNWRWIFYINIPLGMFATFMTLTYIKDSPFKRKIPPMDWLGAFLLVLGIGSLQVVLERGQSEDWFTIKEAVGLVDWITANYISVLAFVSAISIVGFLWRELTIEYPIVNLRVLKSRSLSLGAIFTFILGFGLFASVFVFPIFVQNLLGFTAEQTGLILLPGSLSTALMMPFIGTALKRKAPPQIMAAIGFVLFFIATTMLSKSTLSSGTSDFFWPLIVRGIGLSFLFVPLTTMALSGLRGPDIQQGAGLNNMMRQLGGSVGIALMTTFIASRVAFHRSTLLPYLSNLNANAVSFINGMLVRFGGSNNAEGMAYKALEGKLSQQVYLLAYMDAFFVVGLFFLACIPLLFFQRISKNVQIITDSH